MLSDYTDSISRLVADIEAATHHVHVLTFIFADDTTGQRVVVALENAARRGVQCRLLADAVGSRAGLDRLTSRLRQAGVEVVRMLRVGFFRHNAARFDLRNHRKPPSSMVGSATRFAKHHRSRVRARPSE